MFVTSSKETTLVESESWPTEKDTWEILILFIWETQMATTLLLGWFFLKLFIIKCEIYLLLSYNRIGNIMVIGKGKKPWIGLPKDNGLALNALDLKLKLEQKA